jgi:superoxide reductase
MNEMKRREFLRNSALLTGGLVVAIPTLVSAGGTEGLMTYDKVDKTLFEGINRAANPEKLTGLEKLHVPVIEVPAGIKVGEAFSVTVTVGEAIHPMIPNHYIHWVDLFAGNAPLGRVEFWPEVNVPQATFTVKLDKPVTLIAREYCNMHGLWESRKDVNFSPHETKSDTQKETKSDAKSDAQSDARRRREESVQGDIRY